MESVLQFDMSIFRFVEEYLMNPFTDKLFTFITHLGDGGWLWIILAVGMLVFPRTRRCGIAVAIALLCAEFIGNEFLKHLIARPRPFLLDILLRRWVLPWRSSCAEKTDMALLPLFSHC